MNRAYPLVLFVSQVLVMGWSWHDSRSIGLWFIEAAPALIGMVLLAITYTKFRFTDITYTCIALQLTILFIGAHYSYALVPVFNWLKETFELSRNYFDRLGHLAQGLVPALIMRELLTRLSSLKPGKCQAALIIMSCLGISAFYEIFEWIVAISMGASAEEFLATQGDPWDSQKDMACALIGSIISLLTLSRWQDRQLERFLGRRP